MIRLSLFLDCSRLHARDPRVYKKVSTNGKLTLYLINRDMVIGKESVTPLHAVLTVDDDELRNRKVIHVESQCF